jgi:hypothetical protein
VRGRDITKKIGAFDGMAHRNSYVAVGARVIVCVRYLSQMNDWFSAKSFGEGLSRLLRHNSAMSLGDTAWACWTVLHCFSSPAQTALERTQTSGF